MSDYTRLCELRGRGGFGSPSCAGTSLPLCALRRNLTGGVNDDCTTIDVDGLDGVSVLALTYSDGTPVMYSDATNLEYSA